MVSKLLKYLLLLAALGFSPALVQAEDMRALQSSDVVVYFAPSAAAAAKEIMRVYPQIRSSLEDTVGWELGSRPSIVLISEEAQFRRMAESPLTVAYAVPQKDVMVVCYPRVIRKAIGLKNTLKHELCHLLLHEHILEGRLPRWMDEGVCQWVSDGIADIVMTEKRSVLNRAALRGRFIPLGSLQNGFPLQDQALILAYEESKSFVSHVVQEYGWEAIQSVLEQMKGGLDVSTAFDQETGMPLDELERHWQESVRRRVTWFTYLTYYLYEILFGLAAVLAMIGFVRAMIRKRRLMREYEEEDATLGEGS